ncbi:MAG: DUF3093 domain-containing protein [Actinomycetes bacterium]|jgi:hypothetical protein
MEYREILRWPLWLWLFLAFLASSLSLAVWAALGIKSSIVISLAQLLLLIIFERASALKISVTPEWLFVGRAKIERKYLDEIAELRAKELQQARGPNLDPAAYLALRFWANSGLRISLSDPRDRTPYWLISSRNATKLSAALAKD